MACTIPKGLVGNINDKPPALSDLECIFENVVGALIPLAGLLFFIMFLYGGFKYITSGGDPKAVAGAHTTLTYAIIGLILAALSYMFLLVISYLTGNKTILEFKIFVP